MGKIYSSFQSQSSHLRFQYFKSSLPLHGAVGLQPGNPSWPKSLSWFLCRFNHHLNFISFQIRPIKDLSAHFLRVRVIFFSDKRSNKESRTYLFFLKLRTKRSKKMLLLFHLAILFCYEKVVLSPPRLHPNLCLDIRVISPWSGYFQRALALPSTGVL